MLKVGDIVTPKVGYRDSFKIVKEPLKDTFQIEYINITNNPFSTDTNYCQCFEWEENQLTLIRTIDSIERESQETSQSIDEVTKITAKAYMDNIEGSDWKNRKFEIKYEPYENEKKIFEPYEIKEENKMNKEKEIDKILEIYFDKKERELIEIKNKKINDIIKEDPIEQLVIEMNKQLHTILENDGKDPDDYSNISYERHTHKTEERTSIAYDEHRKALDELKDKYTEVKALVMLADTYEERIKVLKNNNILDGKGNFKD